MTNRKSFTGHLVLFIVVESVFVFLIFHEFPSVNVFTAIGIGHLIYRITVIIAWILRPRFETVRKRFLADYIPVVVHLLVHVVAAGIAIEEHADDHAHDEHNLPWIIIGMIGLAILLYRWETLLHKASHCETHHGKAHTDCIQHGHEDCERHE